METLKVRTEALIRSINEDTKKLKIAEKLQEREKIREEMKRPDFWSDSHRARELSRTEDKLTRETELWRILLENAKELQDLLKLGDKSLEKEVDEKLSELEKEYEDNKKLNQFTGPYDDHDVILNIYAGAGGTDAQDWAQILERMYLRWVEKQGLKAKIIDESPGEEAGIKSATIELAGDSYLYGKLAGEHGVHRLVRKSPFNSAGSRETSFAKVDVLPLINKPNEVEIDDKDLKIDVFRAGGHGGQSVNTTDSAVRVTHLPTGITVAIQNERSQLQNKETALEILRSRLAQLQLEQHAETLADIKGPSQSNEFGSQIRNYILDDRIVKDLRTGYESHDPQKILDGDLGPLIDIWLEGNH